VPATESQTAVRLASESLKFLPSRHITGKVADEGFMQAVSETGYLVLVYQCRRRVVKFFFSLLSGFSMAVVWGAKS
jgi:hypothetical protein